MQRPVMKQVLRLCCALTAVGALTGAALAEPVMPSGVWVPDQKDGTYINPILNGDYSDPDAVRVGDDYYLTASSFTNIPGLPVLHSKDLVNWTLIGYALQRNVPDAHHSVARRGGGVWAPAIRHHNGLFHIYYPDPDFGIFVVTAKDPAGPWTEPVLVEGAKGVIDPAPFWDEDGQGWLVYSYAKSRSGIINVVALKKLNGDGTKTVGEEKIIINGDNLPKVQTSDGPKDWVVVEGAKLYKRDGWYYIFAPAGGVKGGWQGVFRSRTIEGPYEERNVLDQGQTPVNGPHQGAWIDTPSGEDWFVHFQDTDSYGRRVHLQPVIWPKGEWPVIGEPQKGTHYGQPVLRHKKPSGPAQPIAIPPVDDDFASGPHLGWQWQANPADDWRDASVTGHLRLKSVSSSSNLWETGHIFSQKLPGMTFEATAKLEFAPKAMGERAGLTLFGYAYGFIGLQNTPEGLRVIQAANLTANENGTEQVTSGPVHTGPVWLKVAVEPIREPIAPPADPTRYWPSMTRAIYARAQFSYSIDGKTYVPLGAAVTVKPGRWVGSQLGLFAQAPAGTPAFAATAVGHADFDDFSVK